MPRTSGIGLDVAGVKLDARGFIEVDERLATSAPDTWAIGEVAGTPMFTHASFDDYRVLKSQLAGGNLTTKNRLIPYAMFIEPELGRVGITKPMRGVSVSRCAWRRCRWPPSREHGPTAIRTAS